MGPPGVGKGTYAQRASKALQLPHIAAGDAVRKEIKENSPLGLQMKQYTDNGKLVPDSLILEIMKKRLSEPDTKVGFLLDGFPRTIPQAEGLDEMMKLHLVINMQQREDILILKISSRRQCSKCGKVYNYADITEGNLRMPPLVPKVEGVCDDCGSKGTIYQRDDDKEEVVRHRLDIYKKETHPLIEYYSKQGIVRDFMVTGGAEALMPSMLELIRSNIPAKK